MSDEIVVTLEGSCIETAARRELRRLTDAAIAAPRDPDEETAARIALLGDFLREVDFRGLRAARPELAGGRDGEAIVRRSPTGDWSVSLRPRRDALG